RRQRPRADDRVRHEAQHQHVTAGRRVPERPPADASAIAAITSPAARSAAGAAGRAPPRTRPARAACRPPRYSIAVKRTARPSAIAATVMVVVKLKRSGKE